MQIFAEFSDYSCHVVQAAGMIRSRFTPRRYECSVRQDSPRSSRIGKLYEQIEIERSRFVFFTHRPFMRNKLSRKLTEIRLWITQ
jgi:hypothetical protein